MKYHIISTSKNGHGAIFTNVKEARQYQAAHPQSQYLQSDTLPSKIPSIGKAPQDPQETPKVPAGESSQTVVVYTDGSALNNPGPGGYGGVIQMDGQTYEFSQGYEYTTNNRMEMMAVITALKQIQNRDQKIIIHSDSQYTINGIVKGWAKGWRKSNWKKSDGKPALNTDLWAIMLELVEQFDHLSFVWVKGHAGNALNERADVLANSAASMGVDMQVDQGYVK